MKRLLLLSSLILFAMVTFAGGITGEWKSIDDKTGETKSVIKIFKKGDKLYGKIIKLFNEDPNYDPVCDECKDHLKGKKIIGMQIINNLTEKEGVWKGKKGILDPDNGKYYDVKIWVDEEDNSKLNVRGSIPGFAMLGRVQTWIRVN